MDLSILITELSESTCIAECAEATEVAEKYLSEYMTVENRNGNLIGMLSGETNKTVLLDAHIDEIGMMVTNVDDNGFVKVEGAGGIDCRILKGLMVTIHSKRMVNGIFCSLPPHLGKKTVSNFDSLMIDTGLGNKAKDIISVGDKVTFSQSAAGLSGNMFTCKSLDNRAGVAALIKCAELLSEKALPCNVVFLLSTGEETGGWGVLTSAFEIEPNTAISVDVSFAKSHVCTENTLADLSKGPMIGISPVLSKEISDTLSFVAEENNIPVQFEVMGGRTGTNADKISTTKGGIKTGLVSIPLRYMHTPVEIIDLKDVENTARLLANFILHLRSEL